MANLMRGARAVRDVDAEVAKRDIFGPTSGRTGALLILEAGTRLPKSDPRVQDNRDEFVPVLPAEVERDGALLAKTAMRAIDSARNARTVYAGQFVSRDDPMVALHPDHFELPELADDDRSVN